MLPEFRTKDLTLLSHGIHRPCFPRAALTIPFKRRTRTLHLSITLHPRFITLQPRGLHHVIFPSLGRSSCFSRFFSKTSLCWVQVFQTEPSGTLALLKSLPVWEAIFPLHFSWTGKKTGGGGDSFRILEISFCSFREMDETCLSFKPIHDRWRCSETVMFLYSFSSFSSIHQHCVLYTQLTNSGQMSCEDSQRTQVAKPQQKIWAFQTCPSSWGATE